MSRNPSWDVNRALLGMIVVAQPPASQPTDKARAELFAAVDRYGFAREELTAAGWSAEDLEALDAWRRNRN